jgi:beta-xylosidase
LTRGIGTNDAANVGWIISSQSVKITIPNGKRVLTLASHWLFAGMAFAQSNSFPSVVLRGDYPDPSILRDGEDYYLTHSPFLYTPGFLIWHSKDLVNWEPICRAMTKVVGSAMAPDLVKHNGKFYIYFPAAGVNWVIWADNIRGPWSHPIKLDVEQIDPGHAVGEDGKRYLFLSDGYVVPLTDNGLSVIGEKKKNYSGWQFPSEWKTEGMWLESPKLIRRGEYFYMIVAEGGTAGPPTSHMVVAARAKSIHGPWENSPHNPIIHTYSADEPWWSKGHGTLIDDVNGNWWVVYHAFENGYYTLGRQTLLEPVEWLDDGWFRAPKKATLIQPKKNMESPGTKLSDDFSGKNLGLQWTTWRDFDSKSITLKDHALHLRAKGNSPADAQLLLTTARDRSYETEVEITLGKGSVGGLLLFYSEKAFAGISSDGRRFFIYKNARETTQQTNQIGNHFFLKVVNRKNNCDFLASSDGRKWLTIESNVDVSEMHHNRFKGFFALRPGLMAAGNGEVKFNQFQYRELQ